MLKIWYRKSFIIILCMYIISGTVNLKIKMYFEFIYEKKVLNYEENIEK